MNAYDYFCKRNVTGLCHFTKLKDLTHILASESGIVASSTIYSDVKDQKDSGRYDGELDHVCCSIEYPNSWYLRKAQGRDLCEVFKDWIVIYIDLSILQNRSVKFCPCNAATKCGAYIFSEPEKLDALFASKVIDRIRRNGMLDCCPTDDQAEILIKGNIPFSYFKGFAVSSENDARTIYSMLTTYEKGMLPIYLAPDVLSINWSSMVRNGKRPSEMLLSL